MAWLFLIRGAGRLLGMLIGDLDFIVNFARLEPAVSYFCFFFAMRCHYCMWSAFSFTSWKIDVSLFIVM